MNPISEIKKKLEKYPELQTHEDGNFISIKPLSSDGFEVWFSGDEGEFTVGFDGWHEHFDKSEVEYALNCFAFGLSNVCRLKVKSRGGKNYKWVMEALEEEKWVSYSTTALFNLAFWQKSKVKYYSNNILSGSQNN
ncbi:hypothetical protein MNB_SUP05-SYMBIONT-5-1044 [hydrothermal vent metagenome]|uniref:Uncharacterized protein n=1 Tax=hydrothermal vent metagenome TaxID=652676 RepID=A0A1W1E0U3_9ZZZZ